MTTFPTATYTPSFSITPMANASRNAVAGAYSTPVVCQGYSDEWVMEARIEAMAGGSSFYVALQESMDYDPTTHALPSDAHWYDTTCIGTVGDPIIAVGDGSVVAYHWAPLGKYVRCKYTILVAAVEFSIVLLPKSRTVAL